MRKLITALAVCAMAIGVVAVPNALGVKSAKQVGGTVTVSALPTTIESTTTSVTASGSVASNSGCKKDRTVRFSYVNGSTVTPLAATATTMGNGSYTATLPKPTDAAPASVTLRATVDAVVRKVGSKKKGQKTKRGRAFNCLELTADSTPLTVAS
jgi:hypothetical protein